MIDPHAADNPKNGFAILLACLVALLVVPPFFAAVERALLIQLMLSGVLMASLYLVANNRKQLIIAGALVAPALVGSWWTGGQATGAWPVISSVLTILFLGYIMFHLARSLVRASRVTRDMIFASICLYFMLGLSWAFIYAAIELGAPGSFSLPVDAAATARSLLSDLSYFSYVTISTLGYGDIAPVSRVARSWATLEAIIGQFYLAIVVARLVSLHIVSKENASS